MHDRGGRLVSMYLCYKIGLSSVLCKSTHHFAVLHQQLHQLPTLAHYLVSWGWVALAVVVQTKGICIVPIG